LPKTSGSNGHCCNECACRAADARRCRQACSCGTPEPGSDTGAPPLVAKPVPVDPYPAPKPKGLPYKLPPAPLGPVTDELAAIEGWFLPEDRCDLVLALP